ncbi:hypothetical protein DKX38_020887 [Salix brachista]|uniref:Uncharacterized protein n=1 Tax=Salix brachista TaxID=2182728 RepID=A0A5N5KAY9_9ROSI|nr:hypothetical protein DKX38_020887 [Salix brachista]
MVTSHIGISSLNSCFPSLPRLPRPCFTKRKPFAAAAMSDEPISDWILSEGNATQITWTSSIGGGCINNARRYDTDASSFFAKTNRGIEPSMLEGEALGLGAILMSEFVTNPQFVLGRKLAEMHKVGNLKKALVSMLIIPSAVLHSPQISTWTSYWIEFYGKHRLGFQLKLGLYHLRNLTRVDGHSEAEFGMSWCASSGGSFYNAYFECPVLKSLVMPPNVLPCQCQGNSCHSLAQPCNSGSSIWIPKGKVASSTF